MGNINTNTSNDNSDILIKSLMDLLKPSDSNHASNLKEMKNWIYSIVLQKIIHCSTLNVELKVPDDICNILGLKLGSIMIQVCYYKEKKDEEKKVGWMLFKHPEHPDHTIMLDDTKSYSNPNLWARILGIYLADKIKDALASKKIKIIEHEH